MVSLNLEIAETNFIIYINLRFNIRIRHFTIHEISQKFPKILCQQIKFLEAPFLDLGKKFANRLDASILNL